MRFESSRGIHHPFPIYPNGPPRGARRRDADPEAHDFGLLPKDDSRIPGPGAKLGSTRFDWRLENAPPPPKKK